MNCRKQAATISDKEQVPALALRRLHFPHGNNKTKTTAAAEPALRDGQW
jgi:hypothetical protein